MILIKKMTLTVLIMVILIGCSEIFVPNTASDKTALVVEGLITNGDGPFTVKLTKAMPYASDSSTETSYVTDAKLTVTDSESNIYTLTYQGYGQYALPSAFKANVGDSYALHIETSDGNIYESDAQTLLSPESYDTIHTSITTADYLDDNDELKTVNCFDVRVDLFNAVSSANPSPLCRFESNAVIQYEYTYTLDIDPATDTVPTWYYDIFGWKTFQLNDEENITEERSGAGSPVIKNHQVSVFPIGPLSYNIASTASIIYYYRFNQYTINEDTYNFYKAANSQLAASGKLFDPITSQLYGNMKCTSDPSKIVLGLFEVSSVTKAAYVLKGSVASHNVTVRKVQYQEVPASGYYQYKVNTDDNLADSVSTLPEYQVIPYPSWWYHK